MSNSLKISGEYSLQKIGYGDTDPSNYAIIFETDDTTILSNQKLLELNHGGSDNESTGAGLSIDRTSGAVSLVWDDSSVEWVIDGGTETTVTSRANTLHLKSDASVKMQGLTYPNTDGVANSYIKSDGNGNLSLAVVDLENDTSGNYVKSLALGTFTLPETAGLTLSGSTEHASVHTIEVDNTVVRTYGAQTIQGEKTFTDNMVIDADLQVNGTVTAVDRDDLYVEDNKVVLNSNATSPLGMMSGIIVNRGNDQVTPVDNGYPAAELIWDENVGEKDGWAIKFPEDPTYYKIFHGGNTGEGTGLDADTLDGEHGSFYQNASNLNAGILSSDRFNNNSHGTRAGGALHAAVTPTNNGFMSAADKTKLDGIAEDANEYIHPTYGGDDISLDSTALSGATVLSRLMLSMNTDTLGHTTLASASYTTRDMTYDDVGALGATETAVNSALLEGENGAYYLDASNHTNVSDTTHGARGGGNLHVNATASVAGFMSSSDKAKLDGIEGGSNQYIHPTFAGDDISISQSTTGGQIISGVNLTLTSNVEGHVTDATGSVSTRTLTHTDVGALGANEKAVDSDLLDGLDSSYFRNASNLNSGTLPAARFNDTSHGNRAGGTLHSPVTTTVAGFMSAADKVKLNGISEGAGQNQTITAGNGLTGGGNGNTVTLAVGQGSGITVSGSTVAHADTSTAANTTNSGGTVVQNITLDDYGHITARTSVNLDSRYYTESEANTRFVNVSGDTMTGNLALTATPTADSHAINKEYADGILNAGLEGQVLFIDSDNTNEHSAGYTVDVGRYVYTAEQLATEQENVISFEDIFAEWERFSHDTTGVQPANVEELSAWVYDSDTDRVVCTVNSTTYIGFVSEERFEDYVHEVELSSSSADDDTIGVIIAAVTGTDGRMHTLSAMRSCGGNGYTWAIFYNFGQSDAYRVVDGTPYIAWGNGAYGATATDAGYVTNVSADGWSANGATKVHIDRTGDIIVANTTDFGTTSYSSQSIITVDLSSDSRLVKFKGAGVYGYSCTSQASSTFDVISMSDTANVIYHLGTGDAYVHNGSNWVISGDRSVATDLRVGSILNNETTRMQYFLQAADDAVDISTGLSPADADDLYVNVSGDQMGGNLTFGNTGTGIRWNMNTDGAHIYFKSDEDSDTDAYLAFQTYDNGNEYFKWEHKASSSGLINEWMNLRPSGLTVNGSVLASSYNTSSALRYKEDVNYDFADALSKVMNIDVIGYVAKNDPTRKVRLGVTAESVAEQTPEFVSFNEEGEPDSVNYGQMTALLIKVIQEQEKNKLSYRISQIIKKITSIFK